MSTSSRYVCRACSQSLRTSAIESGRRLGTSQIRPYSATPSQLKALASFTPTDRPVLDELFSRWRNDVFLPSVISKHHQSLLYKRSRHEVLTTPPGVSVTVETLFPPSAQKGERTEEQIKLEPKVAFELPNATKSLNTILDELKQTDSAQTWENLIPFLYGMKHSHRQLPWRFREYLVRVANDRTDGRWNTIMLAAKQSKVTGITLADMPLTTELIVGLHDRAAAVNYSLDSQSRKMLSQIIVLLEDEAHCGSGHWKRLGPLYQDMRSSLVVVSTQLAFSASKELQESKGKDPNGKVARDVRKLLAVLGQSDASYPESLTDVLVEIKNSNIREHFIMLKNFELRIIVSAAIRLAQKIDFSGSLSKSESVETKLALDQATKRIQLKLQEEQQAIRAQKHSPHRALDHQKHVEEALSNF